MVLAFHNRNEVVRSELNTVHTEDDPEGVPDFHFTNSVEMPSGQLQQLCRRACAPQNPQHQPKGCQAPNTAASCVAERCNTAVLLTSAAGVWAGPRGAVRVLKQAVCPCGELLGMQTPCIRMCPAQVASE